MAPPKKGTKMDLGSFLSDPSMGGLSWADEEVDFALISSSVAVNTAVPETPSAFGSRQLAFGLSSGGFGAGGFERRERKEFPVPDVAPFRAKISNLPWEANDFGLGEFFEQLMEQHDIIVDIDVPKEHDSDRIRGFAFVEFKTKDLLEEALKISNTEYLGRKIFVSVAAPKNDGWSRAGGRGGFDDVELDWGAARSLQAALPPRERRERDFDRPPRERRDEPDLDWGSARGGGQLPPREAREPREPRERTFRQPKEEGPELDWGSARGSGQLPPREPREPRDKPFVRRERKDEGPELDWGAARSLAPAPRRTFSRETREARKEPELDWSRGQALPARKPAAEAKKPQEEKPKQLLFAVLSVDDDDEDDEPKQEQPESQQEPVEEKLEKLLVADNATTGDGWEVVGK